MKRLSLLLGLAVMLGLSMTAFGQTAVNVYFSNLSGGDGSPTGVYQGTLNGTADNFICADDTHTIGYGVQWPAEMETLSQLLNTSNPYNYTYIANASGLGYNPNLASSATEAWTMEAYLEYTLISGYPGISNDLLSALNYAVWSITSYNVPLTATQNNYTFGAYSAYGEYQAALTAWNNGTAATDANFVRFFVPTGNGTNGGAPQLFSDVTPEPISMALMGTFLSLAGFGLGKKKLFSKS